VNHVVLTATVAELSALRHTPAGIPVMEFKLEHASQQMEAGQMRQVKATMKAMAFGTLAEQMGQQSLGSQWRFSGFLSSTRNGKSVALHIQDLSQE
jgi:primosomal replication protein N